MRISYATLSRGTLLASVSVIAIAVAAQSPARAQTTAPSVSQLTQPLDRGKFWVAIEGGFSRFDGDGNGDLGLQYYYSPSNGWLKAVDGGWTGALEVGAHPSGSPFDVVGRLRYERAKGNSTTSVYYPGYGYYPMNREVDESHIIADFEVGRDVGIGHNVKARLHAGLRFAHFDTRAEASYDFGSGYSFSAFDRSTFTGLGPRAGLDVSVPLSDKLSLDLKGSGAALFGRRTSNSFLGGLYPGSYGTYVYRFGYAASRSKFATVLNTEASAGLTYRFDHTALTLGYRVDAYWNVVERSGVLAPGAIDGDRITHGPFARLKVELGGDD